LSTTTIPSGNTLASNLAMIARIAASAGKMGARRQVFFVQLGGWDHHDEVVNNQLAMLRTVSVALNTFWNALNEFGLQNNVTLFTASDFGRTLTSNGNGSDHAWGGNHLVLGGAVKGGNVYGNKDQGYYPDLQNLAAIDTGQGRLIPGVAVDEYARDLLSWFGVGNGDMDYVLPAFSSRFGGREALGMMGASAPTSSGGGTASGGTTGGGTASGGNTAPPASSGGGGGGGGGAISLPATVGLGALLLLKKLSDRKKQKLAAESGTKPLER
jgi:hypothetical protein